MIVNYYKQIEANVSLLSSLALQTQDYHTIIVIRMKVNFSQFITAVTHYLFKTDIYVFQVNLRSVPYAKIPPHPLRKHAYWLPRKYLLSLFHNSTNGLCI